MIHVVLYQPEIAPNTGNIIRLAANMGFSLHLIHPMGFKLTDKACKRAGLDYRDMATVTEYQNFTHFLQDSPCKKIFACTTKANQSYTDPHYQEGDALLFGPETRGLPDSVLTKMEDHEKIRIPMKPESRSLNLSNAVAIICYEAARQLQFPSLV